MILHRHSTREISTAYHGRVSLLVIWVEKVAESERLRNGQSSLVAETWGAAAIVEAAPE